MSDLYVIVTFWKKDCNAAMNRKEGDVWSIDVQWKHNSHRHKI